MNLRDQKLIYFARVFEYISAEQARQIESQEASPDASLRRMVSENQYACVRLLWLVASILEAARSGGYLTKEQCAQLLQLQINDVQKNREAVSLSLLNTGVLPLRLLQQLALPLYTQRIWSQKDYETFTTILEARAIPSGPRAIVEKKAVRADETEVISPDAGAWSGVQVSPPSQDSYRSKTVVMNESEAQSPDADPQVAFYPSTDVRKNQQKFGPYEILQELGSGGMGKVYKAYHPKLNRVVAIKVMLHTQHAQEKERSRFLSEAKLTAQLKHPNIVALYDIATEGETDYIVMEFIEGESLASLLKKTYFPPRKTLEIVKEVALAIDYAHQHNIVHRDMKPSNVMLEKGTGRPVVMDFGLAKNLKVDKRLTQSGEILGTPQYMAPEQANGNIREISPLTDVYALGAILYEMLTGVQAIEGNTPLQALYNILAKEVIPPRQHNPKLSVDLEAICLKAMEKNPHRRYSSAKALAEDIDRFLNGEITLARPKNIWHRLLKTFQRHKLATSAGLTALVLLLIGTFQAGYYLVQHEYRAQKVLGEWQHWWQNFTTAVEADFPVLQRTESLFHTAKQKIVEDGFPLSQSREKAKESVWVNGFFATWQPYDAELFRLWTEYSRDLPQMSQLLPKYHTLFQDYEKLHQQLGWPSRKYLAFCQEKLAQLPQPIRKYFRLEEALCSSQLSGQLWFGQKQTELCQELAAALQGYNTKSGEGLVLVEWARWVQSYLLAMEPHHIVAKQNQVQLNTILQTEYMNAVDTLMKNPYFTPGLTEESKGARQMGNALSALTKLQNLCLMHCSFAPAYYQLGRLCQQLGKYQEAVLYYHKTIEREPNFLAMHYLRELLFYQWSDRLRSSCTTANDLKPAVMEKHLAQLQSVQEALEKTEEAQHPSYQALNGFYQVLLQHQKRMGPSLTRQNNNLLHFFLCPPGVTAQSVHAQKQEVTEKYRQGVATYLVLLEILEKMPTEGPFTGYIACLQGQLYFDLALLEERPTVGESYFEKALHGFEKAVRRQHFSPQAWAGLANMYYFLGDFLAAENAYKVWFDMVLCPWESENYWEYLICLINQSKRREAKEAAERYIEAWQANPESLHNNDFARIRVYALLSMLYMSDNELERLPQLAEQLDWEKAGMRSPRVETLFYAIIQLKLGKFQKAEHAFKELYDRSFSEHIKVLLTDAGKWQPIREAIAGFLRHYGDPFHAEPRWRKVPKSLHRFLNRFFVDNADYVNSLLQIGNDPAFLKQIVEIVAKEPELNKRFSELVGKVAGTPFPLLMLFELYAKGGIDNTEKYLLTMEKMPSAELCYARAIAGYRRSLYENDPRRQMAMWQKPLADLEAAYRKRPGEPRYYWATALLHSLLSKQDASHKEDAYFFVELMQELGGNPPYLTKEPSFQPFWSEKRWQSLGHGRRLLYQYSWDEIKGKIEGLRQAGQHQHATELFYAYQSAVIDNLGRYAQNK